MPGSTEKVSSSLRGPPTTLCTSASAAISAFGTTEADREADLIGGPVKAVREDGELRRLVRENVVGDQWEHALPIVQRGKRRGEIADGADHRLLAEVGASLPTDPGLR